MTPNKGKNDLLWPQYSMLPTIIFLVKMKDARASSILRSVKIFVGNILSAQEVLFALVSSSKAVSRYASPIFGGSPLDLIARLTAVMRLCGNVGIPTPEGHYAIPGMGTGIRLLVSG